METGKKKKKKQFARSTKEEWVEGTQDFWGSENILYNTVMMDTCQYTFVRPTECTPPRVKPNV